jgi:CubicO group peptidase (beta-lactamase class C family)
MTTLSIKGVSVSYRDCLAGLRGRALVLTMFALATVTALPASAQSTAAPGAIAADPDVLGQQRLFSAWLDGQIAYRGLPGVVVGVVAGDELVWTHGFGHADVAAKRLMTPQTKFRMASHSKLFTATAIMQLREQGKVRLDDPVSQHLSWFRMAPAGDDDGPITIEQLLTHSSGLQREAGDHWTSLDFPTSEELRTLMSDRRAAFAPQVRWKYSNLAYSVAGQVIEAVSGDRWADYVGRHIFTPLGMSSSSVDLDAPGLATGYGRRMPDGTRETFGFVDARGMAAATGITSTVEDMAKFVSAQFRRGARGGDRILGTGSLREMHRVRSLEETWAVGIAIGFSVSRVGEKTYVGHGGSYPGYTTHTLINLDGRVGVIVLTNAADSEPAAIARQLMSTVGEAVAKRSMPKPPVVTWDATWARFAGLYRGRGGDAQVVLLNERLVIIFPNAPTLENPIALEPIGGGRFRYTARTGGGVVGEVVRFAEENGRVVRMYTGDSFSERVPDAR